LALLTTTADAKPASPVAATTSSPVDDCKVFVCGCG
jgi:hypothetical protein